jgi:hypothetical protein
MIEQWLQANPMHVTLFGRWINLYDNQSCVREFAEWMAGSLVQCAEWYDTKPG